MTSKAVTISIKAVRSDPDTLPDEKPKRMIFKLHTGRMALSTDVNLEELIMSKDDFSGAETPTH